MATNRSSNLSSKPRPLVNHNWSGVAWAVGDEDEDMQSEGSILPGGYKHLSWRRSPEDSYALLPSATRSNPFLLHIARLLLSSFSSSKIPFHCNHWKRSSQEIRAGRVSVARRKEKVSFRNSVRSHWGARWKIGSEARGGTDWAFICTLEFSLPSGERMSRNNTLEAAFVKLLSRRKGLLSYFSFFFVSFSRCNYL